jgi:hypothetical protein
MWTRSITFFYIAFGLKDYNRYSVTAGNLATIALVVAQVLQLIKLA